MYDVSIIIPVYNVELYVAECIQSVISQDCAGTCKIECLIVDDCGTDKSMDIVSGIIDGYSGPIKFRIIRRQANGGLSAARNSGIHEAKGKYVYFLDSDDLITPECVGLLLGRASEYPSAQIVTGDFQTFPQKDVHKFLSLQGKDFPDYSDEIGWIRSIFLLKFPVTAWNKLILKDFITGNGLYFKEGILHEDNHWHAMAYHFVCSIAFVNQITYLYRMRPDSITNKEGAVHRKFQNLQTIYTDVLSRRFVWDRSWDNWIFESWYDLKHSRDYATVQKEAVATAQIIARTVARNSACPVCLRFAYRVLSLPSFLSWERLGLTLRFRLNKRLPQVGMVKNQ